MNLDTDRSQPSTCTEKSNDSSESSQKDAQRETKNSKAKRSKKVTQDKSLELDPNKVLDGPAFPLKLSLDNPWLKQRLLELGISRETAKAFGIGYETRANALMAGRVCFPIHNSNGELVAYAGRWASDAVDEKGLFRDAKGDEQPRYKLPTGFQKQLELFNLHRVINQFEVLKPKTRSIVLVEGFWSTLRLSSFTGSFKQEPDHNAKDEEVESNGSSNRFGITCVGLMGSALSEAHIKLLNDAGIKRILLMLDGDQSGRMATEKILGRLCKEFYVKDAALSEDQMPDTVSLAKLTEILEQSGFLDHSLPHLSDMNKGECSPARSAKRDHSQVLQGYSIKGSASL